MTGDKVFETAPSGARQEPETATKAVPAHCADTIKVALLRPGKVLHRSKKRFERTMVVKSSTAESKLVVAAINRRACRW